MTVPAKNFSSLVIDDNNIKWFLTENGLVSFDGTTWTLHSETAKIGLQTLRISLLRLAPKAQRSGLLLLKAQ